MKHPEFIVRLFSRFGYVPNRITRSIQCAWCAEAFEWSGYTANNHPKFCSETHRKRAQEARKKRREGATTEPKTRKRVAPTTKPRAVKTKTEPVRDLNLVGRCPTPHKVTFRTVREAEAAIRRVDPTMHAYRCPCGALHIGHRKKSSR